MAHKDYGANRDEESIKLTSTLKGKVIKEVIYTSDDRFDPEQDIENDNGEITIVFEDGSRLTAWNSEWGGVTYRSEPTAKD